MSRKVVLFYSLEFFFQALVSTEPKINGRLKFKEVMSDLLRLAIPNQTKDTEPGMEASRPMVCNHSNY